MSTNPISFNARSGSVSAGLRLSPSEGGQPRGMIGAVVFSTNFQKICILTAGHVFSSSEHGCAAFLEDGEAFCAASLPSEVPQVGEYVSASSALAFAVVPEAHRVEVKDHSAARRQEAFCSPAKAFGNVLNSVDGTPSRGRVTAIGATLLLTIKEGVPQPLYGALELRPVEGSAFFLPQDAGAAIYSDDGALAGFLFASDGTVAYAVPVETAFAELAFELPTPEHVSQHNTAATLVGNAPGAGHLAVIEQELPVIITFLRRVKHAPTQFRRVSGR